MAKTNKKLPEQPKKRFPWGCLVIVFIAVGFVISGLVGLALVLFLSADSSNLNSDFKKNVEISGQKDQTIAVIPVKGVITKVQTEETLLSSVGASSDVIIEMLDEAASDDNVAAILIDMDTPGGEVLASDLIYEKVNDISKPVYVVMGNTGASGGYYIAAGADKIIVHPNTITGSIGVIAQITNIDGLYDKLGVRVKTFKSGELKDDELLFTEGETELDQVYKSIIDESFDKFVSIVADGRGMSYQQALALADGRIYSGRQAVANGLADDLGTYDDAISMISDNEKLDDPKVVRYSLSQGFWGSYLGASIKDVFSPVSATLSAIPGTYPGFHMYYLVEPLGK